MNKYLSFRKNKYFVRNDLESFLIFYRFFLFRPFLIGHFLRLSLKFFDSVFCAIIKIFFVLRFNFLLPAKKLNANFLISRRGGGLQKNLCIIEKSNSHYKLNKIFSDDNAFKREQKFLNLYYAKSDKILLPEYRIYEKKIVYTFLKSESLKSLIRRGCITKPRALQIYKKIFSAMTPLYKKNDNYQHGDLATENIYPVNDFIYLIDFADSAFLPPFYDTIFLLYRIVSEFDRITYSYFISNALAIFNSLQLKIKLSRGDIINFDQTYKHNLKLKYG
ncbi:MAG: hypothetical protein WCV50_00110 [Patescibacteria group bacterium]|jgi:hypothetical protein